MSSVQVCLGVGVCVNAYACVCVYVNAGVCVCVNGGVCAVQCKHSTVSYDSFFFASCSKTAF